MERAMTSCRSVAERISEVLRGSPDSPAIRSGGLTLSYADLDFRADRIAAYLSQLGVTPGATVILCMDRSIEWVVAALGIMRCGAAYVPLDPRWPVARVRYALEDSGASAIFAPTSFLQRLQVDVHGIDPIEDAAAIAVAPEFEGPFIDPDSLAYMIYTSGSTGAPKGVEITHANLEHLVEWHLAAFGVAAQDRVSHLTGLGFDVAVWEIWPALAAGATLCIPDETTRHSPELIQQWMIELGVTIGFVPTLHASRLIDMEWPADTALRTLLTAGEALPHAPSRFLPFDLVNAYGPTECSVISTSGIISPKSTGTPTIGKAIAGASIYLLDEDGQPVEDGEIGEIYIGGRGVGRGYRNLPEATRKSFLPDPFSSVVGGRMYRSGDRGLRRPNGEIEFHGRLDRQVKIRGHRIELDEISNTLNQHPAVQFAVVTADNSEKERTELTGYILLRESSQVPTTSDVQEYLLTHLPSYMVPGRLFRLKELPQSSSGKIDLSMLPSAVAAPLPSRAPAKEAGDPTQVKVLGAARELLKNPRISVRDNFFLAGGDSLLAMHWIMRIRNTFGVDITFRQLTDGPTAENLSLIIERQLAEGRLAAIWKDLLHVQECDPEETFFALGGNNALVDELQQRIAAEFGRYISHADLAATQTLGQQAELVFTAVRSDTMLPPGVVAVQSEGKENGIFWLHYPNPNLAEAMGDERPFLCVTLTEQECEDLGDAPSLQQIARCFVPKILAAQPKGPYILGGFCLGGMISYEVACQLQAAGCDLSLLILLDVPSPEYYRPAGLRNLMMRPAYLVKRIRQLGLRMTLGNLLERLSSRIPVKDEHMLVRKQDERMQEVMEIAAFHYEPVQYEGTVALIMASELPPNSPPHHHFLPWWKSLIPHHLHTYEISGIHLDLVGGKAVRNVAEIISSHLP
jgi:amino acid adenylation domain-containing protein